MYDRKDFAIEKHITNKDTGVSYTLCGDYYLPDLALPPQEAYSIRRFGRMRLRHLKAHSKVLYTNLLTSGTLNVHLHEVEEIARERMKTLIRQMAEAQGITEQLKANGQMALVGAMNNIRNKAEEIVRGEIIYC